ncbi:hypothetical protein Thimo_2010 [Thioflavicoccus mobilis 8321]|uniref:Type II secretion system protein GspB C-terminal domain-containing protein n=1 Tax=Thioflavicoccus mobilis 8321 TaxID=765912 RepID=L0GXQ9_9GAMM|nr:general secretion pathway protein GspB [Thioflavicoccus mobilis]AGA90771.1 hypothetical protein Thimo_2010 [Thioflavicoccus mobilis 8321]
MSFILEALKRSEQERALGQVPRIDTNLSIEEPTGPRQNPWVLLAVLLAFVAVAIALYAVLRQPGQAPVAVVSAPEVESLPVAPVEPRAESLPQPPASEREATEPSAGLRYGAAAPGAEAPAPTRPPPARTVRAEPRPTPIPNDLIEEIASFKQQVRREQAVDEPSGDVANGDESQTPDPRRPSLPDDVRSRLPDFVITAHVHDTAPQRRFVVINSLRYGEGERTREGFEVLEIQPNGVLLGYEGYSFFAKR